jgi:hypothetical protein
VENYGGRWSKTRGERQKDSAGAQPDRNWILQEAAETAEEPIDRRWRGWPQIGVGAQSCRFDKLKALSASKGCARFDHVAREWARIAASATAPNPKRGTQNPEPRFFNH